MKLSTIPLGELVTITGGGTPRRDNEAFFCGEIPWVTPKDMKRWEISEAEISITEDAISNSAAKLVPKNTVLVVVRSGVLKHTLPIAINRRAVAINQDMKSLRCGKYIIPEFLARFLKFSEPEILTWVRATTADNFSVDKLRELPVPLPPLAEQRRIAAILDQADALRRKRREALDALGRFGQSLYEDALRGAPSRDAELRCLCHKITDGTHQAPTWENEGVPFIFVSNIRNQIISFETNKFVSQQTYEELTKRTKIEAGDVLYTAVGSYGYAAVIPPRKPFIFQRHVAQIKPDSAKIESKFLSYALESVALRRHADKVAVGLAQKTVTLDELKRFPISVPPLAVQNAFAARIAEIDKLKTAHRAHLQELDGLFAALQHRAFRGELTGAAPAKNLQLA